MEKKKILILRACGLKDEKGECDGIINQCKLYDLDVTDYCPKSNDELIEVLNKGETFDYIYLSSHGSAEGFASEDGIINFAWFDFGIALCASGCMNEDCIIMLSCCRGGLNQVAYDLFYCCDQISFIVGPRQSLYPHDMLISFNILLYNLVHRNLDPIVACEKIKLGTDIRFFCFDRLETVSEPAYIMRTENYDDTLLAEAEEAKEKASEKNEGDSEDNAREKIA